MLRNNPENLMNRIDDLMNRITELKERVDTTNISTIDSLNFQGPALMRWEDQYNLAKRYQEKQDDACFLLAIEEALNHLREKTQLPFTNGQRAFSRSAAALSTQLPIVGTLFAPAANYYRNRGIDKVAQRLAQVERWVNDLEDKHLSLKQRIMKKIMK